MKSRKGFASALKELRIVKHLTQEDFSDISSRTYLSSLEREIKSPTLDKVDELSQALHVHPATLMMLAYCRSERLNLKELMLKVSVELKDTGIKI